MASADPPLARSTGDEHLGDIELPYPMPNFPRQALDCLAFFGELEGPRLVTDRVVQCAPMVLCDDDKLYRSPCRTACYLTGYHTFKWWPGPGWLPVEFSVHTDCSL